MIPITITAGEEKLPKATALTTAPTTTPTTRDNNPTTTTGSSDPTKTGDARRLGGSAVWSLSVALMVGLTVVMLI